MLHRLRYIFDHPNFKQTLTGIVEADETYIGGKEGNKHLSKRTGGKTGGKGKTQVMGMLQRGGNLIAYKLDSGKFWQLTRIVDHFVKYGSTLSTDESGAYSTLDNRYSA